jgi:hypothetical protein
VDALGLQTVACVIRSAAQHPDASADISAFPPAVVVLLNSASFTAVLSRVDGTGHVYNDHLAALIATGESDPQGIEVWIGGS